MARHYNVSGEATTELISLGSGITVRSINLSNVGTFKPVGVDLFLRNSSGTFYIFKNLSIPAGVSYNHEFTFNNSVDSGYGLYIKLKAADQFVLTGTIDVSTSGAGLTSVPGTSTLFTKELTIGDSILVTGETRIIESITSDIVATVTAAFGSDLANDASPECIPAALVDVIIS